MKRVVGMGLMRFFACVLAFGLLCAAAPPPTAHPWLLANFAKRLEFEVSNPSSEPLKTLAVVPVEEAEQLALDFPGHLAIAVLPNPAAGRFPAAIVPSQVIDLDGDGAPDEFVFPVELGPHETRPVDVYFSGTLHDLMPYTKMVHAEHAFGYNRQTAALESDEIGYRMYGGFFLDVQGRFAGHLGLNNDLVGFFGSHRPSPAGRDIIHTGQTLGLGGIFLRRGGRLFVPPMNMPDYAHKPSPPGVPHYRIVADGPLRAIVEATLDRWRLGADEVRLRALYSIDAGESYVSCQFEITPLRLTPSADYEVGAGLRHLPEMKLDPSDGRLALSGRQTPQIGRLALGLYYNPAAASRVDPVATPDDSNEAVVFRKRLAPGQAVHGQYWLAAAWSGSGIADLLGHLEAVQRQARASVHVGGYRLAHTPEPQRIEGEAY